MENDKTLRALYKGEIRPCENTYPNDEEYKELAGQFETLRERLAERLDDEGKSLLNDLLELHLQLCNDSDIDNFICGFQLGANLLFEMMGKIPTV